MKSTHTNEPPLVTVITVCYNLLKNDRAGHFRKCLKSVHAQDYPAVEHLVIDGASQDGTVEVLEQYAHLGWIRYISEPDSGIYDAMNKGIKMATGDIIATFNEQFLIVNAISLMVGAIESDGNDGAHADLIYATDEKVKRYWKMGSGCIEKGWMPGHPTLYLKRSVYEKYGLYNTKYKCSADYDFMIRILKDKTLRLAYVPVTIVRMYYGGTSTEGAGSYMLSLKEAHQALKENGIKRAWWIDFRRTIKVLTQFFRAGIYKENKNAI